ncbi:outer membrane beta-barrel protein [Flammeovirga aprica]|uniref:Porin family protein n=1 Tax=Flammeovirga aprica JL-4 TaxID=694437 RepID=A0A7X9NZ87_9BACT|nr:outer membrane beta-barrel protein [Flammeovirga aprica]NME66656.1 porin family protein [Flammeovirga aprica JL-4]
MEKNYLKFLRFIPLILFMGIMNVSFAQEYQSDSLSNSNYDSKYYAPEKKGMEWGFFIGPSWSFPSGSSPQLNTGAQYSSVRERTRTTVFFGFKFNFFIQNNLSVEFDALFNSMGQKTEFSGFMHELGQSNKVVKTTDVLSYFVFPLTANYYLNDHIYIKGGVYGAALAGAQRRQGGLFGDYTDVNHLFKGGDFGVTAGIGAEAKMLFLEWRYSRGLVDVTFDDEKYYNQNIQLVVGLKFGG